MRCLLLFVTLLMAVKVSAQDVYIPKFDLQGHRGARGLKPENTIPGFIVALDSGVTTIELDVAITKDGKVVVSHEPWISAAICQQPDGSPISAREERKFNIYQMTYEEVAAFDCGSKGNERFPQQEKMKISKPLLRDVIIAVEDHIRSFSQYEVDYNIEIKSSPQGDNKFHPAPSIFSDIVYKLLDEYLPLNRIVIQSFDFRVLKYWHEEYPQVRIAALVENTRSIYSNLKNLGFKPSVYSPYYKLLSRKDVQYLGKQRIRVIPWTVNEISDMKRMVQIGVDGFITDYPDRASQIGLGIKRPRQ